MKCWTRIALLATCLLVGIGVTGWADTTTTHIQIKGDTAVASFEAFDPDDSCIRNFVSVTASDRMEKLSPGGGPTFAMRMILIAGQVNVCLGITLVSAQGDRDVDEHSFQFSLSSTTLSTTVSMFDANTLTESDFDVDVTWTATRAPVFHQDKETFHDEDLGLKITSQLRGRHAPAVATGTVVGLGQNFTPEPTDSAELQTENNGAIAIEKTQ